VKIVGLDRRSHNAGWNGIWIQHREVPQWRYGGIHVGFLSLPFFSSLTSCTSTESPESSFDVGIKWNPIT